MIAMFRTMAAAVAVGAMLAGVVATGSLAQADMAVVKERQDAMKTMGKISNLVKNYVEKGEGSPAAVAEGATQVAAIAEKIPVLFPKGTSETDPAAGKTRAKAEIWQNRPAFEKNAAALKTSALALADAAKSGDRGKIKTAFAAMGKNCAGCHKPFRGAKR